MVVRAEKPIGVIKASIFGAAKDAWLGKWIKWLGDLLDVYGVEDPAEVFGFSELDPESVEHFLNEYCEDLVESECLSKVESMIRERGYRKAMAEEVVESVGDYIKAVASKPELMYALPPTITSEIERLRAKPELDGTKAYSIVYDFLIREGCPEDDARKIAEEIKATIPKIEPRRRAEFIESVITTARMARQRTLDEFARRSQKAKEMLETMKKELTISKLLAYIEVFEGRGLDELREVIRRDGYDISQFDVMVKQLADQGLISIRDGRVYRVIKVPKVEVVKVKRVFEDYMISGFNEFVRKLARDYEFRGYHDGCLDWVGEYMEWRVYINVFYGDVRSEKVDNVWRVVVKGYVLFIAVNEKEKYFLVYICSR